MKITDIRIKMVEREGRMKAIASVVFDDEFVVHEIKIVEGERGLFIAMPSRKTNNGDFRDIAHPVSSEVRERIQNAVLQKYSMAAYANEAAATKTE
ncbi:MAG: septation regulator SpoVG [Defluviitaleaceae bacterium]|nr:septation regulator SpoVG [Defluviitaleaceae bacterium]